MEKYPNSWWVSAVVVTIRIFSFSSTVERYGQRIIHAEKDHFSQPRPQEAKHGQAEIVT
jgi:hypothetical protein